MSMNNTDNTMYIYGVRDGVMKPICVKRPQTPPKGCGMANEGLECLGCAQKIGCVLPGHCYAVEGAAALKSLK